MAIDYYQDGKINTVVTINLTSATLKTSGGHWTSGGYPLDKVAKNSDFERFFGTVNVASSICGPEGTVKYESADGSVFTMHFDCPNVAKNVCDASVSDGSPWRIKGTVPKSGANIDYKWTITQKSYDAFIDVPVSAVELLSAPKCNLVSVKTILKLLQNRPYIKLKDVFEAEGLPNEAKLWCAAHDLFLTPQSKAVLTRRLGELAMKELSSNVKGNVQTFEKAMEYNKNLSRGAISVSESDALHEAFELCAIESAGDNGLNRDLELLSVAEAAMDKNLEKGWAAAAEGYMGRKRKEGLKDRQKTLVEMIEGIL